jgi:transcriptional regulator with XRE-family HTH domain
LDDRRIGLALRALRRRRRLRQLDLAVAAGLSQGTISLVERGHLDRLSLATLRKLFRSVDASFMSEVRWRGGALDRLLDERHAQLVGQLLRVLESADWDCAPEVSYSEWGERGSVDVLGARMATRTALVTEVKSELTSIEQTVRVHDAKCRLAPKLVERRFGFRPLIVGRLLVLPESSTTRDRLQRHAAVLDRAYPIRGAGARRWLSSPGGAFAGVLLLRATNGSSAPRRITGESASRGAERPPVRA